MNWFGLVGEYNRHLFVWQRVVPRRIPNAQNKTRFCFVCQFYRTVETPQEKMQKHWIHVVWPFLHRKKEIAFFLVSKFWLY